MDIIRQIDEATTITDVVELQIKVQQSDIPSIRKRPLLKLLDAQLVLIKTRAELGEAFVISSEIKHGDL